jgi:hypothetical protein
MAQTKQASKRKNQASKGRKIALPALGAAGLSLALASSSSATVPAKDVSSQGTGPRISLGEEEISDVSLATFYVFDRENDAKPPQDVILAAGCRGCGCGRGCRGCGGCGRGCGCGGGIWIGGCWGCGGGCGSCWVWSPRFGRWVWAC